MVNYFSTYDSQVNCHTSRSFSFQWPHILGVFASSDARNYYHSDPRLTVEELVEPPIVGRVGRRGGGGVGSARTPCQHRFCIMARTPCQNRFLFPGPLVKFNIN